MSSPTILCVDDERSVLVTLRTQLLRQFPDYMVEIAEGGDEALELIQDLQANGVDIPLVIADQIMPGMKGDAFLVELHARCPQILKVMLTGQATAEDVGNAVNQGNLYRFIAKPWNETDLNLTVTEALRRYQQEQQLAQQQLALEQANRELAALNADLERQVQERTQQLRRNEQQLQLFVEHAPAAIAMFDREMRYLVASRRWQEDYQLGDQEIIGQLHYDLMPDIPDRWKDLNQRCLAGATERCEEDCFIRKDGSKIWNQWEIHPWYTEANEIGGIIIFTQIITDRVQAEIALRESEHRYSTLAENVPVGIFRTDVQGNGLYHSPKWIDIAGRTPDELLGTGWTTAIHPDDRDRVNAEWNHFVQEKTPFLSEYRFQKPDGTVTWVVGQAIAETNQQGHVRGYVGTITDITERKRLETALQQREAQLQSFVEHTPLGVAMFDRQMNYLVASERWIADYDLDGSSILGKCHYDVFPGFREDWRETHQQGLNGFIVRSEKDLYIRSDGQPEWVRWEVRPWYDSANTIGGIIIFGEVISDRIRTEIALQESEERYRLLSEVSPVGIFRNDLQGRCIYANAKTLEITGLTLEENLGDGWAKNLHPADRDWMYAAWTNFVEQVNLGHESEYKVEHRYLYPDGSLRWAIGQAVPERNAAGELVGFIGSVIDITDRKQAEEALRESEANNRAIISAMPDLLLCVKPDGTCLNYIAPPTSGADSFLPIHTHLSEILPPELLQAELQAFDQALVTGKLQVIEHQLLKQDIVAYEEVRIVPFGDDELLVIVRDISDRKRSEAERKQAQIALQQSEAKQRALIAALPDLIMRVNSEGTYLDFIVPQNFRVIGKADELVGTWVGQNLPPELARKRMNAIRAALETGNLQIYEQEVVIDGVSQTEECRVVVCGENEVLVIGRDISERARLEAERKRAETALRNSERRYAVLAENSPVGVFQTDQSGDCLYANSKWCQLAGMTPEEALGPNWAKALHPEDREQVAAAWYQTAQQNTTFAIECRFQQPSGQVIWIFAQASPLADDAGNPVGYIGTITDISNLKQAEAQIRQSQEQLQLTLEFTGIGAWSWHPATGGYAWNGKMEALLELPLGLDNMFQIWSDRMHPEDRDRVQISIQQALATGNPFTEEYRYQTLDGRMVWRWAMGQAVYTETGEIERVLGVVQDIDERKQAEAALQKSESSLAVAQRIAHVGNWEFDLATQTVNWSKELFHIYGRDPNQGAPPYAEFQQQVHPQDWEHLEQAINRAISGGVPYEIEHRIIRRDGSIRYTLAKGEAVFNAQGQVVQLRGTAQDITEFKQIQTALQVAEADAKLREQQMHSLLNNIPHIAWLKDRDGRFLAVNEPFGQACGYSPTELVGLTDLDIWPPQLAVAYRQDDDQVMASKQQKCVDERLITPQGEERWIETIKTPIFNEHGDVMGTVGIAMDVTDRKLSEEALRESERRYAALAEVSPVGIFRFDIAGECVYVNSRWCEMTGRSAEAGFGKNWVQTLHPEDQERIPAEWAQALTQGGFYRSEGRYLQPNGKIVWFYCQVLPETDADGVLTGYVGTATDISEAKRDEVARKQAEQILQNLVEGTASVTGEDFFPVLTQQIAAALNVSHILITRLVGDQLHSLAFYADQQTQDRVSYSLSHTPCEQAVQKGLYYCPSGIQVEFPHDRDLALFETESYLGIALRNSQGEAIGVLCIFDQVPIMNPQRAETLLKIFGARAAAEIERLQVMEAIQNLNAELEQRVQQRTQELQNQTQLLQTILYSMGDGVLVANMDGEVILHNPAAEKIPGLGMPSSAIDPQHFWGIYLPDNTPCSMDDLPLVKAMQGNAVKQEEFMLWNRHHPNRIYIEATAHPLTNKTGDLIGGVAVLRDVSDRKRVEHDRKLAEQKLQAERLRLQLALESVNMGTWESNLETGYWSERTEAIFGYAPGTFPGDREAFLKLVYPEDQERVFEALAHSFTTQSPYNIEYRINRQDGQLRWIAVSGKVVQNPQDIGQRIVGVALDITERKQAAAQLQEKEQFLRSIFEGTENPIFVIDILENGNFCYTGWNVASEKISNLRAIDVLGKTPIEVMGIEQGSNFCNYYRRCLEAGTAIQYEEKVSLLDGSSVWTLTTLNPLRNVDGQIYRIVGNAVDISDRKRAEIQLQASQQFAQSIAENTPNIIYIYDLIEQRNIYCNREILTILGYTVEAIQAMAANVLPSLIHPDDWPQVLQYQQMIATAQDGQIIEQEYRMHHADGSWRYLVDRATVFKRDADGRVQQYIGAAQDVSDRKQAEIALRESRRFLQTVIDTFPLVVFWKDCNSVYLGCNQKSAQAANLASPEEIIGKTDYDLPWGTTEAEAYRADDREVLDSGIAKLGIIEQQTRADGSIIWIETNKLPLYNLNGEVIGVLGTYQDITDRKQAETALRDSEERFRQLAENISQAFWMTDPIRNTVLYASPAYEQIWGHPVEDLYASPDAWLQAVHPSDQPRIQAALPKKVLGTYDEEFRILQPNGEIRWVRERAFPVRDDQGMIYRIVGISENITEQKQAEIILQEQKQFLQLLLDNIPQQIFWKDQHSVYLGANPAWLAAAGLQNLDEIVGKIDRELFPPEMGNQFLNQDQQILTTGLPMLHQLEHRLIPDGSYSWLDVSKLPIHNALGEVIGILGVMENITDRKQAEEALRQSELKYRTIFDNSQVGIFCSQVADGLVLEANQYFVNLIGYESADQVIGKMRTVDFYSPTDRQYVLDQLQQFGVINNFEFQFWNRHGIPQWAMASVHLDPERQLIEGVILDVSDRKQAEANLRDSEERLRLALTAANQGLYDLDLKTGAAIVSPEYATMLGYNPAEFQETNAKWIERLHPDDLERTANVYRAYVAGEIANYKVEFRQRTQQGNWKWILSLGKIVAWDESGQPLRMLGTHTDIDERKSAEASLQAERLRLQLALEAAQMGTWSCNLQTGQLLWSDRAQEIFGFVPGTFPGDRDTFLEMIHPEDYHRVVEAISTTFEHGTPYDIEYRIHRLDGELRWIAVWGIIPESAIFTERQLVGVVTDISDRKQAEAALRQSEARLRATFNQAAVGIVQADRQGHFVQVNQKFCEIVAYPEAEILFKSFAEITHPDDLAADHANVQRLLADEVSTFVMEKRYIRKDGGVVWVTLAVALVRNPANEPEYFIGVIQDISDRKAAEAALIQAKQELEDRVEQRTIELRLSKETAEAANRAKSAFLANMSHELRTPLNAILGFSQLLNRNTALNANQKKQVGIINRSGEHLLNLINDILEMSKIEAGRVTLNLKNFGLYQMLHSLKELFSLRAESKGLELKIQIAASVPEYIQTDESKLRQVLINLLSNAIKFTPAGSVTLRVSVASSSSGNQGLNGNPKFCLSFEVTDTGPGIEPNEQEILFEPFVQTKTGQKSLEGTGLGLPISRQFVQLMGGELTVYSIPGQGATFYFEIPVDLAGVEDLPVPQPTRKVIGLAPGQPVYRLLVVEDNSENRQFLIQLLQSVGFETREAENGQEAVALWQTWAPHLIWMDMRMPLMNGYEATRRVRELEQAQLSTNATQSFPSPAIPTKILALTASAFEDERTAIMAAGCDDFVCKPATETTLFEKIAECVGVRYLYQEETEAEKATNQPRSSSDQLSAHALRVMPPTWIEQLQRAARMADEEVILQLLDLLPPAQASLANALRELVSELCLDQLIELTVDALKM